MKDLWLAYLSTSVPCPIGLHPTGWHSNALLSTPGGTSVMSVKCSPAWKTHVCEVYVYICRKRERISKTNKTKLIFSFAIVHVCTLRLCVCTLTSASKPPHYTVTDLSLNAINMAWPRVSVARPKCHLGLDCRPLTGEESGKGEGMAKGGN